MNFHMMKIAFLCGLHPNLIQEEIFTNSRGPISNAANALQWAILEGFINLNNTLITIFTLPFIRSYPFGYKSSYIKNDICDINDRIKLYTVGFYNLVGYKFFSRYIRAKRCLMDWAKNADGKKIILIYGISSPFLRAAIDVKKKYSEISICLIVEDLPEYMSESSNLFYRLLKRIDSFIIKKSLEEIDSFVLLSDYMAEALNVNNKPWVRVEGIYNHSEDKKVELKEKNKTILYSGNLDRRFGIMNLMNAFDCIDDPNYRLWICGDGNCHEEIENKAKLDVRIVYFGQLTRNEVLTLQKKATVLINPRPSTSEFTKYSFPSKTIEYMASGTPCLMHYLPGIPEEYFQYCFVTDKENAEGLKELILTVCEKDQSELDEFGSKASIFIQEHKNPITQVEKIFNMIKKI